MTNNDNKPHHSSDNTEHSLVVTDIKQNDIAHREAFVPSKEDITLFSKLSKLFRNKEVNYREAIQDIIISNGETDQTSQEQRMLLNVLSLGNLKIEDIMVPRPDILCVSEDTSIEEVLEIFKGSQHSRLPVYRDTLDYPLGFVHIKDALALHLDIRSGNQTHCTLKDIIRDALYTPGSISVQELLLRMQSGNIHMALVIDEYGGTDGIVTIEDLIECVVGNINDEHDTPDMRMFQEKSEGIYEVDARLELKSLYDITGLILANGKAEYDIDTIGGFVTSTIGRVPIRGEIIECHKDCEFHIIDADPKRIKRLRIVKLKHMTDEETTV